MRIRNLHSPAVRGRRIESSSRSPAPPRIRPGCSCPRGPTRDSGSDRVSVDAWGFDVERQTAAHRLRSLHIRLSAIRTAVAAGLALALVLGGAGALRDWVVSFRVPPWVATVLFLVLLFGVVTAVDLPFRYVDGYRLERTFGLSAQRFAGWMKDLAKSLGLGLGSTVAAGSILLWLLGVWPMWWWLAAWLLSLAVSVVLAFLAPIVLVPLFFRFRPLEDPSLRARFESLAAQPNVPLLAAILGLVSLPLRPLELSWSRAREARADRFSLQLTHDPANFATAMAKLHDQNLGVADPRTWEKWLFYSHPPGRERVELARSFRGSPA